MNSFNATGRLTKDPDVRMSQNGTNVARFTLATGTTAKGLDGKYQSAFINCVAFGKTAELIGKYFRKGSQIGISGEWRTNNYKDRDGKTRTANDCAVNKIDFLDPKRNDGSSQTLSTGYHPMSDFMEEGLIPIDDEDLPF